jgi:hypothetical protein
MFKLKQICTIILFSFLFSGIAFSQNHPETIQTIYKFGPVFKFHNKILKPGQLLKVMKDNPAAYKQMKSARRNYIAGNIFGQIGGFMFGWPLGAMVVGGEFNAPLFITGAGLVAISMPFTITYSKQAVKAVEIYNDSIISREMILKKEDNNITEDRIIANDYVLATEVILYYSSYSKLASEVCLYENENKKVCLTPGNYYKLKLPLKREEMNLKLVSQKGDYPLVVNLHEFENQLFLFKFNKKQEFSVNKVNEETKKEIIRSLKEGMEVK